ncbi:hypothetical protein [Actinoplanes cyaneus]|uniref:hypothetical protein n=1 Tax=Actinoplanes cyaneus TaxID=52696 RepID=UPI00222698A9|nr:hypothetical protein [Actinoplanes cyaneus]MCW2144340.1 hypothetical protein [Actinoplanes cyaneus]
MGAVIAVALATTVVTAAQLNLPSKKVWEHPAAVAIQWMSVAVLALFIVVTETRQITHLVRANRIREYDLDLQAELSQVLCAVVDLTGARWDEVSVSYYRVRWYYLLFQRRLVRIASVRLGVGTSHAAPWWAVGVGVVGSAFDSQESVAVDWGDFSRRAILSGKDAWNEKSASDRFNMNWGQLNSSPREQVVLATPSFDRLSGETVGCLLLSGALKLDDLSSEGMERILKDLATAVDRLGPPPRGWWSAHEL